MSSTFIQTPFPLRHTRQTLPQSSPQTSRHRSPTARTTLTSLANNTLLLTHNQSTILIDPWFHSPLTFLTPAFYTAPKPSISLPHIANLNLNKISAIFLTQSLPDHPHKVLPRAARHPRPYFPRSPRPDRLCHRPVSRHLPPAAIRLRPGQRCRGGCRPVRAQSR